MENVKRVMCSNLTIYTDEVRENKKVDIEAMKKTLVFDKATPDNDYFAFAKFLSENFEWHDKTDSGDEYIKDGVVFTEKEVMELWEKVSLESTSQQ